MSPSGTAYYLYCLTPGACAVPASAIRVDGQQGVMSGVWGGMGAVYSQAGLGEFCGELADAHLQDLAWLGPRICRHEAVIEEIGDRVPVLPARFATLFTSLDSIERFVLEHRDAVAGFFNGLGDQREWGVKGLLDRDRALEGPDPPGRPAADEPTPAASPGARYLERKRTQAQRERDFNFRLKDFCRRVASVLAGHAGSFRERKVPPPITAETEAEVVCNWAFLVSPAAVDEFRGCLEQFNRDEAFPGLRLTLTGPWPPYSFVPDLAAGAQA